MSAVPSAIEAALQKVDEPTDEELLRRAGFISSFRAGPKAELSGVNYDGQHMSLKAAQELEKKAFSPEPGPHYAKAAKQNKKRGGKLSRVSAKKPNSKPVR